MGKLRPITRDLLRAFYEQHPLEPVPEACEAHLAAVNSLIGRIIRKDSDVEAQVHMETPTRIDDIMWRSRQFCEEVAHSLGQVSKQLGADSPQRSALSTSCQQMLDTELAIRSVQASNTEAAAKQVKQFLPKDVRGSLLEMRNQAGEARNQRQVADLVARGGTIRARYELLLEQQWSRRVALAQMGELSGIFKFLVRYMGGIPQVLLDFAKEINAKQGPMEEQRLKYGPQLYRLTDLGIRINVAAAAWADNVEGVAAMPGGCADATAVLAAAIQLYTQHLTRVVTFLGELFIISPFFVAEGAKASSFTTASASCLSSPRTSVSMRPVAGAAASAGSLCGLHLHASTTTPKGVSPTGSFVSLDRASGPDHLEHREGEEHTPPHSPSSCLPLHPKHHAHPQPHAGEAHSAAEARPDGRSHPSELTSGSGTGVGAGALPTGSLGVVASHSHKRMLSDVPEDYSIAGTPNKDRLRGAPGAAAEAPDSPTRRRSSHSSGTMAAAAAQMVGMSSVMSVASDGYESAEEQQAWSGASHSGVHVAVAASSAAVGGQGPGTEAAKPQAQQLQQEAGGTPLAKRRGGCLACFGL